MTRRRTRAIILALIAIVLSMTLISASTFALFSDRVTVKNHLQAGSLQATLVRTAHSYKILDNDGYLKLTEVTTEAVNANTVDNVFGLPTDALIAPQSVLTASFRISNNSTVAFDYVVELVVVDASGNKLATTALTALHEQLVLEMTANGNTYTLKDAADGTHDFKIVGAAPVVRNGSADFTVKLSFKDDNDVNNNAMDQKVYFDIIISAVQHVERPTQG